MPYEVTVDQEARIVVVRGFGEGTTEDTLQLIEGQRALFERCAGYDFLYDSAALRITSAPADMMRVTEALFAQAGASFRRFAVVVPEERIQLARIFTALAEKHGIEANVFRYVEDARHWLAQ